MHTKLYELSYLYIIILIDSLTDVEVTWSSNQGLRCMSKKDNIDKVHVVPVVSQVLK